MSFLALAESEPSLVVMAAVGVALLSTGAAMLPLSAWIGSQVVPERRVFFARWGGRHFVAVLVAGIVGIVAAGMLLPFVDEGPFALPWTLLIGSFPLLFAGAAAWQCAKQTEPNPAASLGFVGPGVWSSIAYATCVYLLFLPAYFGAALVWPWVLDAVGDTFEQQSHLVAFHGLSGAPLALSLLLAVVVVPFIEEFVFRGFLQPFLVQNFHDRGGVVLTAFVFAILHGTSAFLPIFVVGLMLGAVALRTRRIYASWALHALHNGLTIALFLSFPEVVVQQDAAAGLLP